MKKDRFSSLSFVIRRIPSSFRRKPESRGVGRGNVARRLVLRSRQAANQPYSQAPVQKARQPVPRFFIPWCAAASRDERLL